MARGTTIFSKLLVGLLLCAFIFGKEAWMMKSNNFEEMENVKILDDFYVGATKIGGDGHPATDRALTRESIKISSHPSPGAGY